MNRCMNHISYQLVVSCGIVLVFFQHIINNGKALVQSDSNCACSR